jgi:ribonuclease HII
VRALERRLMRASIKLARARVAGVDEAGRGPLAGPVVAAAVILNARRPIFGLADSKTLPPEERTRLAHLIRTRALAWGVGWSDCEEIDSLNILHASMLAMRRALLRLPLCPTHVVVDGDYPPRVADLLAGCTVETVVDGDAKVEAISAASILAKTVRDALMERIDAHYPGFDLAVHKGYATADHLAALRARAPTPLHRRSFEPVREALALLLRS